MKRKRKTWTRWVRILDNSVLSFHRTKTEAKEARGFYDYIAKVTIVERLLPAPKKAKAQQ